MRRDVPLLLFIIIKVAFGYRYVELKNGFMSDGVLVHHGKLSLFGTYKMFHANNPSLEAVQYGDVAIFPLYDYIPGSHSLFVEYFVIGDKKIILVHVFTINGGTYFLVNRIPYRLGEKGFDFIDMTDFSDDIMGYIQLALDINTKNRHPYIKVVSQQTQETKLLLFTVGKTPEATNIAGHLIKNYEFGHVYDSEVPIVVGRRRLNNFVNRCTGFEIVQR